MSQENVGYVIDRLLTDSELRFQFAVDPLVAIADLHVLGLHLTPDEIDAFVLSDARCWVCDHECVAGRPN
jgi:hypothetical protein